MPALLGTLLLMQAVAAAAPDSASLPQGPAQDSAAVARLGARLEGQPRARVRVDRDWVQLAWPTLGAGGVAYQQARVGPLEERDSLLPNPLPLERISVVQVRGKRFSLPAVALGGLSVGVSVLASALLSKAIDSRNAPDNRIILRGSLIGFGLGAALGGIQSVLITRWLTVYRR